jgi:hypothetical protein
VWSELESWRRRVGRVIRAGSGQGGENGELASGARAKVVDRREQTTQALKSAAGWLSLESKPASPLHTSQVKDG